MIEGSDCILTNVELPENFKEKISEAAPSNTKKFVQACVRDDDWNPWVIALPKISWPLRVPMVVATLDPPVASISTV
jgi:hypothetical protein